MNKSKLEICIGVVVCSTCFIKAVSYGGSKHASPTNSTPPVLMASRPWLATPTPPPANYQLPSTNYQLITNWTARGAYCDWQPITFPDTFRFPVGTNLITSLTLFAWGEVRFKSKSRVEVEQRYLSTCASGLEQEGDILCSTSTSRFDLSSTSASDFDYSLPTRVSLAPAVSSLTHGLTPSNSYLFSWHNACANRSATNRVDASIELFRSGAVAITMTPTNGLPTTIYQLPTLPEGYVGIGQDADWIRATFPNEADAILAQGYDNWLLNDYVGINVENGHALIRVTVDPSAFNQSSTSTSNLNLSPIYLACGPYRVNVTEPGTYAFPLEVLTHCEVRTYPTPIPLTFDFDDGYRGDYGPSFEVVDLNHPAPRPLLLMAKPDLVPWCVYRFYLRSKVVVSPNRISLAEAVGTQLDFWCNVAHETGYYYTPPEYISLDINGAKGTIRAAYIALLCGIRLTGYNDEINGCFEIYGNSPTNENGIVTNRVDATIFSGDQWHTESLGNRRSSHHLTAVTQHDSTAAVTVSHTHAMAEGVSAYVAVYMASTEPDANPAYDDSVSWSITSNGGGSLSGSTSVFASSSALANAVSWENELYGVEYDPLFLCGQLFTAPPDDVLRLSLSATAQNATDGLRETCVQIVVYPVDTNGNIIGLPTWVNQN